MALTNKSGPQYRTIRNTCLFANSAYLFLRLIYLAIFIVSKAYILIWVDVASILIYIACFFLIKHRKYYPYALLCGNEIFVFVITWTLLSLMPAKNLEAKTEDWLLIGIITSGLIVLFIFDLVVMLYFNKQLKVTAKEAKSASKAKTDFLSTMSHDIRTPMNAIIGLTTITEKNLDDKKSVAENLRKITLASNHGILNYF